MVFLYHCRMMELLIKLDGYYSEDENINIELCLMKEIKNVNIVVIQQKLVNTILCVI
jgi:hypothetical protein